MLLNDAAPTRFRMTKVAVGTLLSHNHETEPLDRASELGTR